VGSRKKYLPTPAMFVAILALLVALGGSAYAVSKINSKDIQDGSIKTRDLNRKLVAPKAASVATLSVPKDRHRKKMAARVLAAAEGTTADSGTISTLSVGETKTLIQRDPFTISASCADEGGGVYRVTVSATSSEENWIGGGSLNPRPAGDTASIGSWSNDQPTTQLIGSSELIAPSGASLSLSNSTLGVKVPGNGDCLVSMYAIG
jgi:hypothetical protein